MSIKITDLKKDTFFIGTNGKEETLKQHWFFTMFFCLDPNHRNIDGLIKWYNRELKKDEQRDEKDKVIRYKKPSRVTLYDWYNKFQWKKRVIDAIYKESQEILDTATEYNVHMLKENTKLSMQQITAHTAIVNIYTYYSTLFNNKVSQNQLLDPQEIELLNSLTKIATNISYHQQSSPTRINEPLPQLQEWNEIKERLQPHHNPYTSKEEWLKAQFEAVDYYYDNYDTE